MITEHDTRLAIFDLGNVVFGVSFDRAFQTWSDACGVPAAEIKAKFHYDPDLELLEIGQISPTDYHLALCKKLGIDLTFDQFVEGWNAIFEPPFEATHE